MATCTIDRVRQFKVMQDSTSSWSTQDTSSTLWFGNYSTSENILRQAVEYRIKTPSSGATSLTISFTPSTNTIVQAWNKDFFAVAATSSSVSSASLSQSNRATFGFSDAGNYTEKHTVTINGKFLGNTYYYVTFGANSSYSTDHNRVYLKASNVSITSAGTYGGCVFIDEGGELVEYDAYIDSGTALEAYDPYYDDGTNWILLT